MQDQLRRNLQIIKVKRKVIFILFRFSNASHYPCIVKSSGRGKGEPLIVSDEDSQPDTVSVVSSVSDNRSVLEEGKFLIVKNT